MFQHLKNFTRNEFKLIEPKQLLCRIIERCWYIVLFSLLHLICSLNLIDWYMNFLYVSCETTHDVNSWNPLDLLTTKHIESE